MIPKCAKYAKIVLVLLVIFTCFASNFIIAKICYIEICENCTRFTRKKL